MTFAFRSAVPGVGGSTKPLYFIVGEEGLIVFESIITPGDMRRSVEREDRVTIDTNG
jgi:hypothetical protein